MSTTWDQRLAAFFEGRRWRVRDELSGVVMTGPGGCIRVTYAAGSFEIDLPGVFVTPLGHRGRRGYIIAETGDDGRDIPDSAAAFGLAALRRASLTYGTVTGLPAEESDG